MLHRFEPEALMSFGIRAILGCARQPRKTLDSPRFGNARCNRWRGASTTRVAAVGCSGSCGRLSLVLSSRFVTKNNQAAVRVAQARGAGQASGAQPTTTR
ncbi:MAG: hypothetical protein ACRDL7_14500, partial [Gaiellaceae bacterium]